MTKNSNCRTAGNLGEEYAAERLSDDGYTILCRNYTCRGGEIDIIAEKGSNICFIEVKTRSLSSGLDAAEAVVGLKSERMSHSAACFLEEYRENAYVSSLTPRFDVFEIYTCGGLVAKHNHIIGII